MLCRLPPCAATPPWRLRPTLHACLVTDQPQIITHLFQPHQADQMLTPVKEGGFHLLRHALTKL